MKRNGVRALWGTMVVFGFLTLCCVAVLDAAQPDGLGEADAIALVRQVNTAQITIFNTNDGKHQYVSLRKLLDSPAMNSLGKVGKVDVTVNDDSSGTVKDHILSVIASADVQHFLVSLAPRGCGLAIFSNESGVIYLANAAGCN
jgi:hypothetical protein